MGTETDWVYRVLEPHGSDGWRPYGTDPERWRGTITADDSSEGPQYALSLVVADLMTEWKARGLHRAKHVRIFLWRDEEGDHEDADAIVEVRPSIHTELPSSGRVHARSGYRPGEEQMNQRAARRDPVTTANRLRTPRHGDLRNLAIGALRLARKSSAADLRHNARDASRPIALLDLTGPRLAGLEGGHQWRCRASRAAAR
ncbi:hypothetical protein ABZ471_47605 [Streptomyces sp. NPDC005728]|uniref:hypothetical protein n=1 Tax=Streptomyces sp. NPDC005728 TaxID=3157054 RepID=UPI0033CF98AE